MINTVGVSVLLHCFVVQAKQTNSFSFDLMNKTRSAAATSLMAHL